MSETFILTIFVLIFAFLQYLWGREIKKLAKRVRGIEEKISNDDEYLNRTLINFYKSLEDKQISLDETESNAMYKNL